MEKGETTIRYFLENYATTCNECANCDLYGESCCSHDECEEIDNPLLIAEMSYPATSNFHIIIPRIGEKIILEELIPIEISNDNVYDYYLIDDVEYVMSNNYNTLIDVMVVGYDWEWHTK